MTVAVVAAAVLVAGGFLVTRALEGPGDRPSVFASPTATTASTASPPSSPTTRGASGAPSPTVVAPPPIVQRRIPFPESRRREMVAYAERHYGIASATLRHPRVIVEHFTGGTSFDAAWNTFASNTPDLGELPGTCAHFIVDTDGTIYQLVPLSAMCRHTVGLNYTAFGIEDVGTSDAGVLGDAAQLRSMLRLTLWLMARFHIELRNVIGHNESLTSPFHKERVASWRCQTHQDWQRGDMDVVRARLRRMAEAAGVPIGPPAAPVTPDC
ncbi:MAG: N-acetylmuramoyl-L-alanine amidase [Actinomycetota bacterium]